MKIIDLSTLIHEEMSVYPGDPKVKLEIKDRYEDKGWELRELSMGTHTGTHVDSFSHMHPGKRSIEQIPLERFFGEAMVVEKADDWPEGLGLFFIEEVGLEDFNQKLANKPNFVGGNLTEDLERALLADDIITYTDLVNLERIPLRKKFIFYGFPLKIKDGDGSPVRAIAMFE